jgi:hypothetical protein
MPGTKCRAACEGRRFADKTFCSACWYRLPEPLQRAITSAWKHKTGVAAASQAEKRAAVRGAYEWLRANDATMEGTQG